MPSAKTLAVGLAIVTILGFTVAMAVPMGPSFSDDDPENSGVTSAQEPGTNETGNESQTGPNGNESDGENGSEENGSDNPPEDRPCDTDGEGEDDSNSCSGDGDDGDDGAGDQDGEKDKDGDDGSDDDCDCDENGSSGDGDDGAGDQDGEKDKDGDDGDGSDGDDSDGSDGDDSDGNDGDDGNDGNDGDDGNETAGTCTTGGLQGETVAYQAFGTENEDGPISSQIHENEEQFQDGQVLVHEGSCIIATVDNNANGSDGAPNGSDLPGQDELPDEDDLPGGDDGNESDGDGNETGGDGDDGDETAGTCTMDGLQGETVAYQAFGTENEDGPISSQLHENEEQFQDGQVLVHEGSCIIATVDNNANGSGGDLPDGDDAPDGGDVPDSP